MTQDHSALAALRRPLPHGLPPNVILPNQEGLSLPGVTSLIETILGTANGPSPLADRLKSSEAERVVLLILDGLGYNKLQELWAQGEAPNLKALSRQGSATPISSVFPSTTATALSSLATGLDPIAHGMLGYRLYLREIGAITNMLKLSIVGTARAGTALDAGLDADRFFRSETIHQRLSMNGVATHAALHHAIVGSGLSNFLYRGCRHVHSVASFDDMCVVTRQLLARERGRVLVSLYWSGLDSIGHSRGPDTESYVAELRSVDATLGRELINHMDGATLLVTSDHGFVPLEPADFVPFGDLRDGVPEVALPPTGEPRASYLYATRTAAVSEESVLRPDGLLQLSIEDALDIDLFGSDHPHPEARHRLGDYLLTSTSKTAVLQPYTDSVRLPGMHGGLTDNEMIVPLIAADL